MRINGMRDYIRDEILNDATIEIEPDQNLLLTETLDSLAVIQLVEYLETTYGVTIPPEGVTLENFATLRLIDGYVSRLESGE